MGINRKEFEAIVVGSGPNGLAAAITLLQRGLSVLVLEAKAEAGGGCRSAELTLPGFVHDVCSSVYPMGIASPFFQSLSLENHGLRWVEPDLPFAHPLDGGRAALFSRDISAMDLGSDSEKYQRMFRALAKDTDLAVRDLVGPFRLPKHPWFAAKFGMKALQSAEGFAKRNFEGQEARALWAGIASHSVLPFDYAATNAISLVMAMVGHSYGWPFVEGGARKLTEALCSIVKSLGGEIECEIPVRSVKEFSQARLIFFDLSPKQILEIEGVPLSQAFRERLRKYRYGPGVFKVDWALSEPIPWQAKDCLRAGTVHIGGSFEEIAEAEGLSHQKQLSDKPFVLLTQASLFDKTRAPEGRHTAWAYCHVPHGCMVDRTAVIEQQIERFAPGFKDIILARYTMNPESMERYNANYVGGDIVGGMADIRQIFSRPLLQKNPYHLAEQEYFICSASSPPGGGVHGLSGYYAARSAINGQKGF